MKTTLLFTFLALFLTNLTVAQIPEEGLVGYYKLDDGTYVDSSTSGVDLEEVPTGGVLLPTTNRFDEPDKALKFINMYLNTASNPNVFDFDADSMMSLCAWIKIDQTVIDWTGVLNNWGGFGLGGYYLGITPDQQIRWNVNAEPIVDSDPVPTGEWMHIAATYDGDTSYLYINGNLVGQAALSVPLFPSAQPFTVGAQADVPANVFPGVMDDILVYNRPVSAQEIMEIMTVLSIEDISAFSKNIMLFPNPVDESFTFNYDLSEGTLVSYTITDLKGSVLFSSEINEVTESVAIGHLSSGIYLINFKTIDGVIVSKRIVKN